MLLVVKMKLFQVYQSITGVGGWTLGGVCDVCMLYEHAGDQYACRSNFE